MITLIARFAPVDTDTSTVLGQLSPDLGGPAWDLTVPVFTVPEDDQIGQFFDELLELGSIRDLVERATQEAVIELHPAAPTDCDASGCVVSPLEGWNKLVTFLDHHLFDGLDSMMAEREVDPTPCQFPRFLFEPLATEVDPGRQRTLTLSRDPAAQPIRLKLVELEVIERLAQAAA